MAKNIEIKYYVTYIRADQYVDILPLNEEGFEDIAEIDYLTLDYTKENFQKKIALQYPNIENPQVFITRVKKNKETNESELKNYTILYKPDIHEALAVKIATSMKNLANMRQEKRRNADKSIRIDLDRNQKENKVFTEFLSLLLKNTLSKQSTLFAITNDSSIIDPKLKEYLQKCRTVYALRRLYPYIKEKVKSYKVLRGLLLEYLNAISKMPQNLKEEVAYYQELAYPYSFWGFDGNGYLTFDEANYGYTYHLTPYDTSEITEKVEIKRK